MMGTLAVKRLIFFQPLKRFPFSNCLFQFFQNLLKVELSPSKKKIFIWFNEISLKMMKNAFYSLLVLKIFKFLSAPFGHVEKMALLEMYG